jgi:peptide/nickel transport system substrate-binding protein
MSDGAAWQKLYYTDGESQMSFWGAANGPTGDRGYFYFHSAAAHPTGSNGWKGYHYDNPTVDKLLEDARVEFDQAKQDALYQQVCEITKQDQPNLYLWQTVRFHVVSKKVGNMILIPAAGGGSYYDAAEKWTISQ